MAFDGSILDTAETRAVGFTDSFTIGGNDVDIVAVELVRGRVYEFDVDGDTSSFLRLFDPFGNQDFANTDGFLDQDQLRANDDGTAPGEARGGSDPFIRYVAQYTGIHYVAVSPDYLQDYVPITLANRPTPINPLPPTTGTLSVRDLGPASLFVDDDAKIPPLSRGDATETLRDVDRDVRVEYFWAGGTTDNFIDGAGDRDAIHVSLAGSDLITIEVDSTFGDSRIEITDMAGNLLAVAEGGGDDGDAELTLAVRGEFKVTVTSLTTDGGAFDVVIHRNPTVLGQSGVDDLVDGTPINDFHVGLSGDDTLIGLDGNDTLSGGDGDDVLSGGENEDEIFGDAGDDFLEGRAEDDLVFGGTGDDSVFGNDGFDSLSGDAGDDTLFGGRQNDTMDGGDGADGLTGNEGADRLWGGAGDDVLRAGAGNDQADGEAGADQLFGSLGNDTLTGGAGTDSLEGEDGRDDLFGGEGADTLLGAAGIDRLFGDAEADLLDGGGDADTLEGGAGGDTLFGGAGAGARDVFLYRALTDGVDLIADLTLGSDVIDVSRLLNNGATPGDLAAYVLAEDDGAGGSLLSVDPNGANGGADFTLIAVVAGVTPAALLEASNFVL